MGAESVGYHERTVLERGDDPVGNALDYYASRGETPMVWGGAGAASLALDGEVSLDEWRAIFGPGGACDPEGRERLVHCMRPGMEIVVSPHKSVAELGVIGKAEDITCHSMRRGTRRLRTSTGPSGSRAGDEGARRRARRPTASHGRRPAMRRPKQRPPGPRTR